MSVLLRRGKQEGASPPAETGGEAEAGRPERPHAAVGARIEALLDAAEKAAAGILDDAESQAQLHLEKSKARVDRLATERLERLHELTESLVRKSVAANEQVDRLIAEVESVALEVREERQAGEARPPEGGGQAPAEAPPPQREPDADAPERPREQGEEAREQGEEAEPPRSTEAQPEGAGAERPAQLDEARARLLATRMAVAGSEREAIAARLREELGITDPDPMLDEVLGPE